MKGLYKASLRVVPSGAGSEYGRDVWVAAASITEALKKAKPTTGYYSFEVAGIVYAGEVSV